MFETSIADLFDQKPKTLTKAAYKKVLKHIHTTEVSEVCVGTSKLPQTTAPKINRHEEKLPREARVKLSQLRSGYSTVLNGYNSRLNINVPDQCELCKTGPHDTYHRLNCPKNKTELTVHSLWNQPVEAAAFLKLTENKHDSSQSNWSPKKPDLLIETGENQ